MAETIIASGKTKQKRSGFVQLRYSFLEDTLNISISKKMLNNIKYEVNFCLSHIFFVSLYQNNNKIKVYEKDYPISTCRLDDGWM